MLLAALVAADDLGRLIFEDDFARNESQEKTDEPGNGWATNSKSRAKAQKDGVTVKNVPSRTTEGMKFPGAPHGLKMACGENPKRVYAARGPSTRMGNIAVFRRTWQAASDYRDKWKKWRDEGSDPAKRPDSHEACVSHA